MNFRVVSFLSRHKIGLLSHLFQVLVGLYCLKVRVDCLIESKLSSKNGTASGL